jgi:hypothetical protein
MRSNGKAIKTAIKRIQIGFIFVISCTPLLAVAEMSTVPIPSGVKSVLVGEKIIQNGLPLEIQGFNSALTPEAIVNFYKSEWAQGVQADQPGYIENNFSDWLVISRLEGNKNTLIQVKKSVNGGSEGFISVSEPFATKKPNKLARTFPKMGGSQLISTTESDDIGKTATTLIFQNTFSVKSNVNYYKSNMQSKGWSLNYAVNQGANATLLFAKGNAQCDIAINKNDAGQTTIFANIVSSQ